MKRLGDNMYCKDGTSRVHHKRYIIKMRIMGKSNIFLLIWNRNELLCLYKNVLTWKLKLSRNSIWGGSENEMTEF